MASNNSSEYKVIADKIVSPDEDIVFRVEGALYLNSIEEDNRVATIADIGEGGGGRGAQGTTGAQGEQGIQGATGTQGTVGTQGTTGAQGITGADGADGTANTGDITFDGIQIIGAGTASGDGSNLGTIELVPDGDITSDQYLIIDPTGPNHIHIRAGGAQDYSTADLILGGERAGVKVSDTDGTTTVRSKKEDYVWTYANANDAEGPVYIISSEVAEPDINDFMVMNGTKYVITSVTRNEQDGFTSYETTPSFVFLPEYSYTFTRNNGNYAWEFVAVDDRPALVLPPEEPIIVNSAVPGDITLSAYNGVKLSFADTEGAGLEFPDETVQTTAYLGNGAGNNEEIVRYSPNFQATGLTFTGSGATYPTYNSHYVKNGRMVSFFIEIDLATVTNFGTGQYKTALPFAPLAGTMNHFSSWVNIDPEQDPDLEGHVILQADHLANTTTLDLHYIKQDGGAKSALVESIFTQGEPATLTTDSVIYINGTYITAS